MGMSKFNSDDHYINSYRGIGVAFIVNKTVPRVVPGCSLKTERMSLVHFQDKPFNITVIQVYALPLMLNKLKLNNSMKTYEDFL